jgi:hypothetical protein
MAGAGCSYNIFLQQIQAGSTMSAASIIVFFSVGIDLPAWSNVASSGPSVKIFIRSAQFLSP